MIIDRNLNLWRFDDLVGERGIPIFFDSLWIVVYYCGTTEAMAQWRSIWLWIRGLWVRPPLASLFLHENIIISVDSNISDSARCWVFHRWRFDKTFEEEPPKTCNVWKRQDSKGLSIKLFSIPEEFFEYINFSVAYTSLPMNKFCNGRRLVTRAMFVRRDVASLSTVGDGIPQRVPCLWGETSRFFQL